MVFIREIEVFEYSPIGDFCSTNIGNSPKSQK